MKYQTTRFALVALCIMSVLMATACPQSKADKFRSAVDASYRLPASTNDVIAKVTEARDRGFISVEQSKSLGEKLNAIAKAEVVFVGMVKAANETFKQTGALDTGKQIALRDFFNLSVISPFLDILTAVKLLSPDASNIIGLALSAARILIRTIGGGLGASLVGKLAGAVVMQYNQSPKGVIYA